MSEELVSIQLSDGCRVAATMYLPESEPPWPAVLEALPYRKDDVTAYDTPEYRRLRDEGDLAVCRVDLRGTGSSEGIAVDEYPAQEQKDLCEVVAWLSRQPWCTGSVGMYGASYSGFNSLQVAMQRPAALKAIIAIFATDDRYTDDVHYGGGALHALDLLDYPLYMVAMNALPPVPAVYGHDWRAAWEQRVEGLRPWLIDWLERQVDGPYWRHGSLRPGYDRIACATMIVAGWADGYRNATFRAFEGLTCPKRLLIGPWAHASTETSLPGPRIDLVPEQIRWWNRWLCDGATDEEPPIKVFVRHPTPPAPDLDTHRGEWRYEEGWPPSRLRAERLALGDSSVGHGVQTIEARGDVGVTASIWCSGYLPFGQPSDQRPDEVHSLVCDWPVVNEEVEILGQARLQATVTSSAPVAYLSAKLCDVFPDGTSTLVSRGLLNLTHRHSHADPRPLQPGRGYEVAIELDATSWVFEPGHRIRLDLAGADWPNLWPPPTRAELALDASRSTLILPVLSGPPPVDDVPEFPPPRPKPARAARDDGRSGRVPVVWREEHDLLGRERRIVIDHGAVADLEIKGKLAERYRGFTSVSTEDPGRARAAGSARYELSWPGATVATEARLDLTSDADAYHLELQLDVSENGSIRRSRRWQRDIPRRLQ